MPFSLKLSDEQAAIKDLVATLAKEVLGPFARDAEHSGSVPEAVLKRFHETGLAAPVPVTQGGDGVPDALARLLITEGLAYGDPSIAVSLLWSAIVPTIIGVCGTDQQRDALLPRFASDAAHRGGFGLYEGYGRAPSEFETTITKQAGGWHVHGRKLLVQIPAPDAPLLVIGHDNDGTLRAAVMNIEDVTIRPSGPYLGLDAIATATVEIDAALDEKQILARHDGDELAREVAVARLSLAAASLGGARRALDYAAEYAQERVAFGRPISSFQGVAFLVAEGHMQVQAAWLQLRQTLDLVAHEASSSFEREVSHAVAYATSVASEVTRDCIQVLGGHGFLTDHPVERWYRATAGLSTVDLDPTTLGFAPAL